MKILSNTLKTEIGHFDDPGDYPSGAGSAPLPSHDYVESVDGQITVEFTPEEEKEIAGFADVDMGRASCIEAWLKDDPGAVKHDLPGVRVTTWSVDDSGDDMLRLRPTVLSVEEFEADAVEPPEPDCDDYDD